MKEDQHGDKRGEAHNHECMSCGESWECPIPAHCLAGAQVMPSIVLKGPKGAQVFDHVCQRKPASAPSHGLPPESQGAAIIKAQEARIHEVESELATLRQNYEYQKELAESLGGVSAAARSSIEAMEGSHALMNLDVAAALETPTVDAIWNKVLEHRQTIQEGVHVGELYRLAQQLERKARRSATLTPQWPALPGQKALTFLMLPDESGKAADAAIEALKRGDTTFIPTPISELFFHQLRLHVARDPTLVEKIAVYYLTPERQWAEVGLSAEDELRWPVGFCHEAWEAEIKIKEARQIRRADGRADAKEKP